ncbi:hypothetical protein OAU52_00220 [bacterium]|nr:hypothetical protein [bacterium]
MLFKYSILLSSLLFFSCKEKADSTFIYTAQNPYISESDLRKMNPIKDSIQWVSFKMAFSETKNPQKHHAYAYSDDQHNGKSQITFKTLDDYGHCFEYHLEKHNYPHYPYTGWGQNFDEKWEEIISKFEWMSYSYKGVVHSVQPRLNSVKDYAHYRTFLPETSNWTKAFINLNELTQPSFAKKVEWKPSLLYAVDWLIQGSDGEMGSLCIGNIKFGYPKKH